MAKERSIWLKFLGVLANVWGEDFFMRTAQLMGTFVTIDDSTRDMVRLDVGRVLIFTKVPEIINKKLEIKVNGVVFSIRILEEPSGDNFNSFYTDWKYQCSEGDTSDEDDSLQGSVLGVPETVLSGELRDDDLQRLREKFQTGILEKKNVSFEARIGVNSKGDVGQGEGQKNKHFSYKSCGFRRYRGVREVCGQRGFSRVYKSDGRCAS